MSDWTEGYTAEIEYSTGFYKELAPFHLHLAVQMQGVRSPDPNKPFTYFEIGSGQGFSANLFAAVHPQGRFWANDFNPVHVVNARTLAQQAGLTNVEHIEASFADVLGMADLPAFDFITLHGVYSWITPENRGQIVEFIRRKLKPGGVVYCSYNAFPGWGPMVPIRRLLTEYAARSGGGGPLTQRMKSAFDFAKRMVDVKALYFANNPQIAQRLEQIGGQDLHYVAHEYFNKEWNVLHFADVVDELNAAKLNFVGSAYLPEQFDRFAVGDERLSLLQSVTDPVMKEMVKDFMMSSQFRRDIFVRGAAKMNSAQHNPQIQQLRIAPAMPRDKIDWKMKAPGGEIGLKIEVYEPIYEAIAKGPKTIAEIARATGREAEGIAAMFQSIAILAAAGYAGLAQDEQGADKRKRAADQFNAIVFDRSQSGENIHFFASPVLGSAVIVDKFEQLMLALADRGGAVTAEKVLEVLRQRGQQYVKDGKVIEDPQEELAAARERVEQFNAHRLPYYRAIGISMGKRG